MTKPIRLSLALLVMISGAIFAVSAAIAVTSASATPYGHPFKCRTVLRHRDGRSDVLSLRCRGILNGTFQKYHCRYSPTPSPDPGSTHSPSICPPGVTSGPEPMAKVLVVIHSTPRVLGTFTANSDGVVNATIAIPKEFTGNHTIEARVITGNNPAMDAPVLSSKLAADTTRVMLPITVGVNSDVTRTAASAPVDFDSNSWVTIAVVGLGALGLVMLAGGGLLMFAGRRRREMI